MRVINLSCLKSIKIDYLLRSRRQKWVNSNGRGISTTKLRIDNMVPEKPGFKKIIEKARESVLNFDSGEAESAVREAVDAGMDPVDLIELGFIEGMKEMGDRFEKGDVPLVNIVAASRIMERGLSLLKCCAKENHTGLRIFGNIVMNV
jgi:methanogenic corrinoid protein MtbC1